MLLRYLEKGSFRLFAIYRVIIGAVVLVYMLVKIRM